jgi:hypothetical protein
MCGGVEFHQDGVKQRLYFPNPEAKLPVRKKAGEHELVAWGRRKEEPGDFPPGGWARLDSIRQGKWDRYVPRPVKIDVERFMEKDNRRNSHWFDMPASSFIQGLLVEHRGERRVYVVTVEPDDEQAQIHDRWPRILSEL